MPLFKADGTEMYDADITAAAGEAKTAKTYVLGADVFEDRKITSGTATKSRRLKHRKGESITQAQLDSLLAQSTDTEPEPPVAP